MFFSVEGSAVVGRSLQGFGKYIVSFYPGLKYDLKAINARVEPSAFAGAAMLSALVWGFLFFCFALLVTNLRGSASIQLACVALVWFSSIAFFLHLIYPGILARKLASETDRELVFALQDLMMQVNSGIPLYDGIVNISNSGYGQVSVEFSNAAKQISAGTPEREALEALAIRSESESFKKTMWQLVTTLQSGASIKPALKSVIETLLKEQYAAIQAYSSTLNFTILLYMLLGAVMPSIGITLLTILASFSGMGINESFLIAFAFVSIIAQAALIGFMNQARPRVYG
jgi:flagellar protein FlaJ